jgi:hypothetical protein
MFHRESLQALRSQAIEYNKALEEKKKALEKARQRDLLVKRVRQEEEGMSKFFEFLTSSFYSLSSARKRSPKTL